MFGGLDTNIMKYLGGDKIAKQGFDSGLSQTLGTMWGSPSLFNIEALNLNTKTGTIFDATDAMLNTAVLNIETATITETPIEEWIAGQWIYTHGRPEMRQITFTFRDSSNSWLYRNFNTAKNMIRNSFPDDQKWTLHVKTHSPISGTSDGRFSSENFSSVTYQGTGSLIYTENAILESISSISLNQSDPDGFLTFSVTFKYMNHVHNTDFDKGTEGYYSNPATEVVK